MNRWVTLGLLFATSVALALRSPELKQRPLHNDEAVNALKFGQLWEHGIYKYDPNEHHGPSLLYATYTLARVTAAPGFDRLSEATLRAVPLLFGLGLILLLPLVVDGLGRKPLVWAAIFTAVSPAMVYYSRYYIHEMLLVWFAFLAIGAGWRYWRRRKIGWILVAGAALGLMHATKETFLINLIAGGLAIALNQAWNRWADATAPPERGPRVNWLHLVAGLGMWAVVALVFFTSFFSNWSGPLDSLRTYAPWFSRAGGDSPHIYAWHFYFDRLLYFHPGKGPTFSEALLLGLGAIGAAAGFFRKKLGRGNASFVRFLALYTAALAAGYALIPYKTPWCLLSFLQPLILLAGVGTVVLVRALRPFPARAAVVLLISAGVCHLAWQAWLVSVTYPADQRNPYVYAHTSADVLRLVEKVNAIADASREGRSLVLKVVAPEDDYWPLPWYLRAFHNSGYWAAMPPDPFAPLIIVAAKLNAQLDDRKTHLMVGYFELRPTVFLELYVQKELWMEYLKKNPPRPD